MTFQLPIWEAQSQGFRASLRGCRLCTGPWKQFLGPVLQIY